MPQFGRAASLFSTNVDISLRSCRPVTNYVYGSKTTRLIIEYILLFLFVKITYRTILLAYTFKNNHCKWVLFVL